jgi:hypothetical protein
MSPHRRKSAKPTTAATMRPPSKALKLSREAQEIMEESVERAVRRWARRLILVIDGEVRKLTPEEIEGCLAPTRLRRGLPGLEWVGPTQGRCALRSRDELTPPQKCACG